MPIKIYRLIYLTLAILLVIEVGLEIRAQHKGWNTILGGMIHISPANEKKNQDQVRFGPSENFPFRSMIVPFKKDPKICRLWIASSSYAQDIYLDPSRIFPNLIGRRLNQSGFRIQVLNAAQEGQTIIGNLKVLKDIGKEWKPDFILLYQMNLEINELSQPGNKQNTNEKTPSIKPSVNWGEKFIEKTTVYQLLKENVTARLSQSRILINDIGENADAGFRQRIYDFISVSRSLGAAPILCTFATSHDLRHQREIPAGVKDFMLRYNIYLSVSGWFNTIDRFNNDIRQIGKEQNILVIDINPYLSGHPEYFRDFVHFNPKGHQMIAKIIAEKLLENRDVLLKAAANKQLSTL